MTRSQVISYTILYGNPSDKLKQCNCRDSLSVIGKI